MVPDGGRPMIELRLDRPLLDAFVAGRLNAGGEATLATEVARLLPFHASAPNPIQTALSRLVDHLGGESALFAWLDGYPGQPRLVARLYVLIGILDDLTNRSPVVTALRELRARIPYPPGLSGYLASDTTTETLASL